MATHSAERRSDGELRSELDMLLDAAEDVDVSQAEVLVSDGLVVLLGTVPDYATKRRVEALCRSVEGVQEIHDQLLVSHVNADAEADPAGFRTEDPRADHTRSRH